MSPRMKKGDRDEGVELLDRCLGVEGGEYELREGEGGMEWRKEGGGVEMSCKKGRIAPK